MAYEPVYGLDVSHWNAVSDAEACFRQGNRFVWCKATEGTTYTDPTFARYVDMFRRAGFVVGGYHFMRGGDARAQARHFKRVAGNAGVLSKGSLLPMLDMEAADARSNANNIVNAFYDELGVDLAEVYGNLDWWRNVLRPNSWGDRNILGHIARYNGDPGNPGWSYDRMAAHQHSSSTRKWGIAGNVDGNVTLNPFLLADLTLGRELAPTPPPPPQPTPPPAPVGDCYTVKAGDTLSEIAARWGVTVSALAVANKIANPDLIYPGQRICKPGAGGSVPGPRPGRRTHKVVAGDTLSEIAQRYGTTVAVLVKLNGISNPDRIYVGQVLTLPSKILPAPKRVYIVKPGDTLSGIAARLGTSWQHLARVNKLRNPDRIFPGQVIHY